MDNNIKSAPESLKFIRSIACLSQSEMADLLGLDQTTLSAYETGKLRIPHNLSSRLNPVLIQADQNVYLYQQIRQSLYEPSKWSKELLSLAEDVMG